MIDTLDKTTHPARGDRGVAPDAPGVTSDVHEILDDSLSSIIGNARLIALETGEGGEHLSRRLAAIIDSARKISLVVHRQLAAAYPADVGDETGKSELWGRTEGGAGERPCWT